MMAKQLYKRIWRPPSPTIDHGSYGKLLQKRKLAELREAVLSGNWQQVYSDESESDSDGTLSTSCTASPHSGGQSAGRERRTTSPRPADSSHVQQASSHSPHSHHHQQDVEFELTLKAAAEEQLAVIHSKLLQEQAHEQEEKLADKQLLEQQHADTSHQITAVQQRLEELKKSKHELINQLKLAVQAETAAKQQAAAAAQAAQAAAQQAAMQQQQQPQPPPPPQQQDVGPHPALPGPLPLHQQQQQQQQHSQYASRTSPFGPLQLTSQTSSNPQPPDGSHPQVNLGRSASGALLSPGPSGPSTIQRLFSSPPPPPPPPRQQQSTDHIPGPGAGSAAAGPAGVVHPLGLGEAPLGQQGLGGSGGIGRGGSSGAAALGYGSGNRGSRGWQESGRQRPDQQQQQQQQRPAAIGGAPDSPEEGEALPSPKPRSASAAAALAAGAGAGGAAGSKVPRAPGSSHASAFAAAAGDRSFGRSSEGHSSLPDQYGQLPRSSTGRDLQQQQQQQEPRRHGPPGDVNPLQSGPVHLSSRSPTSKHDSRQGPYNNNSSSSVIKVERAADGFGPQGLSAPPAGSSSWQRGRPHWEDGPLGKGDREEGPGSGQHHQQQWRLEQQRRHSSSGGLGDRFDGPGPGLGPGPAGAAAGPGRYVMSFSDRERERERDRERERGGGGGAGGNGLGRGAGGWW